MPTAIAVAAALLFVFWMLSRSRGDIDDAAARELVQNGATLLDVRSPGEFAAGHVDGAVNVPVNELAGRLDKVPRDKPVVLYCASGMRSARAAGLLRSEGYGQVHNLGAMPNW